MHACVKLKPSIIFVNEYRCSSDVYLFVCFKLLHCHLYFIHAQCISIATILLFIYSYTARYNKVYMQSYTLNAGAILNQCLCVCWKLTEQIAYFDVIKA